MKRRTLVLLAVALVMPTLGLVALYLFEDWRGARAWKKAWRELDSRGETLDLVALSPPPVADDQNLALAPALLAVLNGKSPSTSTLGAKRMYEMPAAGDHPTLGRNSWMAARPLPLAKWQQYYAKSKVNIHPAQPGTPAADVLVALSEFAPFLDAVVREAESRPQARLPIDWKYEPAIDIRIPQAMLYMQVTETLRLRASAELASGQYHEGLRDTITALRLCAAIGGEPLMIGLMTDASCTTMAIQPIWEGLASRRWTADELGRIQTALRGDNHLVNYTRAMRGDRAVACLTLESLRTSSANGEAFLSGGSGKPLAPTEELMARALTMVPRGWIDQNKAGTCLLYQRYIDAVDLRAHKVSAERLAAANAEVNALRGKPYLVHTLLVRIMVPWTTSLMQRAVRVQTACDQAEAACALERYYLDHQTYPDTLDLLVPAYLDRVPSDVIDGAPMRYGRTGDGRYRLYGVGWDGRDHGGTIAWQSGTSEGYPARPDDKGGDWVWQYVPMDPPAGMAW